MERLLDEISFEATDSAGTTVVVDATYVNSKLEALAKDEDLSRWIL